jgi:hypothetical protein
MQSFEGMVFDSHEEAHYFYHDYTQVSGFNMRIRRYVCSCEGHCSEENVEVVDERFKVIVRRLQEEFTEGIKAI